MCFVKAVTDFGTGRTEEPNTNVKMRKFHRVTPLNFGHEVVGQNFLSVLPHEMVRILGDGDMKLADIVIIWKNDDLLRDENCKFGRSVDGSRLEPIE